MSIPSDSSQHTEIQNLVDEVEKNPPESKKSFFKGYWSSLWIRLTYWNTSGRIDAIAKAIKENPAVLRWFSNDVQSQVAYKIQGSKDFQGDTQQIKDIFKQAIYYARTGQTKAQIAALAMMVESGPGERYPDLFYRGNDPKGILQSNRQPGQFSGLLRFPKQESYGIYSCTFYWLETQGGEEVLCNSPCRLYEKGGQWMITLNQGTEKEKTQTLEDFSKKFNLIKQAQEDKYQSNPFKAGNS